MLKKWIMVVLLVPCLGYASWQVAGSPVRTPDNRPTKYVLDAPKQYRINPRFTLQTHKGALRRQLQAYINHTGWRLSWRASRVRPVILLNTTLAGPSLPSVLNLLFAHYSLAVSFRLKDKTLVAHTLSTQRRLRHWHRNGVSYYRVIGASGQPLVGHRVPRGYRRHRLK